MQVEFRAVYSVSHFINITDKLCTRLAKAFPAALTSSGRGEKHTVLSPVHQAFKLCPNCMQNDASGQETFPPVIAAFVSLSFIMLLILRVSLNILQIMCR